MKKITLQYFAVLREQAGCSEERLETAAATPAELYEEVRARHGFTLPLSMLRVAVNEEFRDWSSPLEAERPRRLHSSRRGRLMQPFAFSTMPIDAARGREALADPACGGYATFEGWVRDHNEGRAVRRLEYEAYAALAEREGERIVAEAIAQIRRAARRVHPPDRRPRRSAKWPSGWA